MLSEITEKKVYGSINTTESAGRPFNSKQQVLPKRGVILSAVPTQGSCQENEGVFGERRVGGDIGPGPAALLALHT